MIVKYSNLSEEELQKLKTAYCISYKDEELEKKETDFLLKYREGLKEGVEYIWKSNVSNEKENLSKAKEKLIQVANFVADYMRNATSGNIRQRLLFIHNIDKEFSFLHSHIQWGLHKYSSQNALICEKKEKEIADFIKLIAVNTLENNFNVNEILEENAYLQTLSLKKKLKNRFMQYIDEKNLSFYDNYFLIGECLNRISEIRKKEIEIQKSKCDGCIVDDCAVSKCQHHADLINLDIEEKSYKRVVEVCAKRLHGKMIEQEELDKAISRMKNIDIRRVLTKLVKVPPIETRNDRFKKIEIGQLTRFPSLIDQTIIKRKLAESLDINEDKEYYKDINLIISSLLLTRCDYSGTQGEEFVEYYKQIKDNLQNRLKSFSLSGLCLELIENYNKELKEKEKE